MTEEAKWWCHRIFLGDAICVMNSHGQLFLIPGLALRDQMMGG